MKIVFLLLLMAVGVTTVKAGSDDITLAAGRLDVQTTIQLYGRWAKQEIALSPEVAAMKTFISVQFAKKTHEEALKILDEVLAKQAGVEVVHISDKRLFARKIKAGKD